MERQNKKEKWLHIRLSEQEYNLIHARFDNTFTDNLSQYARNLLMGKPMIGKVRDQSLDAVMSELVAIRKELSAYGKNFNQVAKKVNQYRSFGEIARWAQIFGQEEKSIDMTRSALESLIKKLLEKWLQ